MPSDDRVRVAMDALAQTLGSSVSIDETLLVLTEGAVHAIPGASHASITVRHTDGNLETLAATDPLINELDASQYELREGPCYDTVTDETFHVCFDLATDLRWPNYGPRAAACGIHAQLAVHMTSNDVGGTALNVYASEPHEFTHDSVEIAEVFASHAAVTMGYVRTVESFGHAVRVRQRIGQATGIVMERYQIDEERAFNFLVRVSRDSNVNLRAVAADFVSGLNRRTHAGRRDTTTPGDR